jgi:hypothetical protein
MRTLMCACAVALAAMLPAQGGQGQRGQRHEGPARQGANEGEVQQLRQRVEELRGKIEELRSRREGMEHGRQGNRLTPQQRERLEQFRAHVRERVEQFRARLQQHQGHGGGGKGIHHKAHRQGRGAGARPGMKGFGPRPGMQGGLRPGMQGGMGPGAPMQREMMRRQMLRQHGEGPGFEGAPPQQRRGPIKDDSET